MKKLSQPFSTTAIKLAVVVIVVLGISFSSCKKEDSYGKPVSNQTLDAKAKSLKLRKSTAKVLKDFIITFNANQQAGSGGGSNSYSNVSTNYTTYSTANGTVYSWSDPTTGSSYTLTQSSSSGSSSGSGLGQLSYGGKSFDYGYVLSIKASTNDPTWSGFFGGNTDLRGLVAIDGQMTSTDFTLRNLCIFLVMTNGGSGTYKFIDWTPASVGSGDGIGELLDFSDVTNNTSSGFNDPNLKICVTSEGHVTVSDQSFDMNSDAKVTDQETNAQFSISGSIMLL